MTRNEVIKNLQGVICPVVTPFNRRGDVDEGFFRENLSRITGIGLAGILVAGSTGEAPYLAESERLRLVEVAREVVKAPEILMVGTGLESTNATVKLSREAVARGADALLVLTPNYYKPRMDSAALVAHYRRVAAGVTRPVLIYSIPQFTGLRLTRRRSSSSRDCRMWWGSKKAPASWISCVPFCARFARDSVCWWGQYPFFTTPCAQARWERCWAWPISPPRSAWAFTKRSSTGVPRKRATCSNAS